MTVSHAANFSWRAGIMGDLIPLLGDGLLTIDGDFHRQSRKIMLPAFHRERIAGRPRDHGRGGRSAAIAGWQRRHAVRPLRLTRVLALRIAMRALFGLDPDGRAGGINAAHEFEEALGLLGARLHAARSCAGRARRGGGWWPRAGAWTR